MPSKIKPSGGENREYIMERETFKFPLAKRIILLAYIIISLNLLFLAYTIWLQNIFYIVIAGLLALLPFYMVYASPKEIEIDDKFIYLHFFVHQKIAWDEIIAFDIVNPENSYSTSQTKLYYLASGKLNIFNKIHGLRDSRLVPITYLLIDLNEHYRLVKFIENKLNR